MLCINWKGEGGKIVKVLVTGGAGFIGYHLAKELLVQGYKVVIADDFSRGVKDQFLKELEQKSNAIIISVDLMRKENLLRLGGDFDYIYHLAAIIGVQNVLDHPYEVLQKNVILLMNLIDFARTQKGLKRFIFASTSEIYAGTLQFFQMDVPTPEATPLTITPLENARTSYMLSKIYGEALMQQSKLPFTIIRPHNFYGPRMGMSHVIPELLKKAYNASDDGKIEVFSVNHKRSFCYISDAVKMICMLSEAKEACGQTYNIGNESPEVTMQEIAEIILRVTNRKIDIDAKPATEGSPARRCPAMHKTKECIGYSSEITLEEGIRKTFDWYKTYIFDGNEVCEK